MQYKINQPIEIRFQAVGRQTGITDLKLIPSNPNGIEQPEIALVELGGGLYRATFTPNQTGYWWVIIKSIEYPENYNSKSYFVGTEYNYYPTQETGKITDVSFKLGEVQDSPTAYTLLARLKNIYDRLVVGIIATVDKVKIWDGTNIATVTTTGRLKVSQEPPTIPVSSTAVIQLAYGAVATYTDTVFIIPNVQTLQIQRFSAGAENNNKSSRIELWYDPSGNGVSMSIIDVLFCNGASDQHDLNSIFIGNGVRSIRMRRENLSGGSAQIFGRWEGYY